MRLYIIIALMLANLSLQSQHLFYKPGANHMVDRDISIWNGGPEFDVTEVPEKWKNESGVIIAYKSQEYLHASRGSYLYTTYTYRFRIKIQDKAAVQSFSNTFNKDMGKNFKIKIVKPGGEELFVDPDDLSDEKLNSSTEKFSIPNLEVGDILDYYYSVSGISNALYMRMQSLTFVDSEFPMMYREVEWLLHERYQFKFKGVNGLPKIEEHWYNSKGNIVENPEKANFRQVVLKRKDISRQLDARYVYNAQVLPFGRYQIFFASVPYFRFSSPSTKLNKTETAFMSYKDIGDFVYKEQKKFKSSYSIRTLLGTYDKSLVKKNEGRNTQQTLDLIKAIHHTVKFKSQPMEKYELNSLMPVSSIHDYEERAYDFSSLEQIFSFANEFDEHEIDYDIIAITPINIGSIEEVMFEDEMKYAIRVNLPGGNKFYYSGHGMYNDYNVNNYLFEGAKGIVVEPKKKRSEEVKFEEVIFPISSYLDNVNTDKKNITFSEDMKVLNIVDENSYIGKLKVSESFRTLRLNDIFDVYTDQYKQYPKNSNGLKRARTEMLSQIKEERIERYKEILEVDYEVSSYDDIEITNSGIIEGEPLIITENYSLDGLVKKAGNKFIVSVGVLIGSQVALEDDEYERSLDVYQGYPRSFINDITISIPDGYVVEDVSPLNIKIDNETGHFESTCKIEGNTLVFHTVKSYKVNFLPSEKWPLMTEFLDTAFDLSQKKILLTKN